MVDLTMRGFAVVVLGALFAGGALAKGAPAAPTLTAAQIVDKNVAARGGVAAWRKIQTMIWAGHMESINAPVPNMPFVLEQKRPNKTRFEISSMNQHTSRVFDGVHGWKMRPARGGRPDVQPYTPQELKFAREAQAIEGPLIDLEAKGNMVDLQGVEKIEGRNAYRLNLRLASGEHQTIWIDAQTFLDVRLDRMSFNSAGMPGMVTVFYRNYQTVEGLKIPSILEIGVGSGRTPDKMVIEKISLNPPLDDRTFDKPGAPRGPTAASVTPLGASRVPPGPLPESESESEPR